MSTLELRTEFHKLIDQIKDETYLREVMEAMRAEVQQSSDIVHELSRNEVAQLPASLEAVKQGRYTSNDQLKKEVRTWLTK